MQVSPELVDLEVSRVKTMRGMFFAATCFHGDVSTWDVSNVDNMFGMFGTALALNEDLSAWNLSSSLKTIFNRDISSWDVF